MNNNATSGAYILEIDWVMLYLVFGGHFIFWQKKIADGHYELPCKIWSL